MSAKTNMHFTDNYLLQPTNPIVVNIIGAGGTGSQVLTAMARMHHSLLSLGHPGLFIQLYDNDTVSAANLGRQLFTTGEIGLNKAVVLIHRINRFFGCGFKAIPMLYNKRNAHKLPQGGAANLAISCVDTVAARFEIAGILECLQQTKVNDLYKPLYWMDIGNSKHTGQVLLSSVGAIRQPNSRKYTSVGHLPFVTEQFKTLLMEATEDHTPSCSLAEALTRQDLFINSTLANIGASILWSMFREGMTPYRGFFLNLKNLQMLPVKV
jgi:PRTRC genetic system ThiF family protein